ncbi:hypothetical protein [Gaetbulibacter saemankumensis]|uniref:hypothetical protein n=1 Tax=Gaetbulibacter saemankumensis TaxID=311208 RepID=UPI000420B6C9|nr:hypothetical protein [Gaetbulibacter saemankumensis]
MARDIRDLYKNEALHHVQLPEGHEARFLEKLDTALPKQKQIMSHWLYMVASVVVFLGIGLVTYNYFNDEGTTPNQVVANTTVETKTLGDISPGLKKVEDYYLASINLELSKIKYTPETKEMFDGYIMQLEELDKEYKRLSRELTEVGPSELTVNALIDNLKFRLSLLYRLKSQLKALNPDANIIENSSQSI